MSGNIFIFKFESYLFYNLYWNLRLNFENGETSKAIIECIL